MSEPKIGFYAREENGQIGYLSDGIAIPEFFDLVRKKDPEVNLYVLVDYSPVMEALHSLHKKNNDEDILNKFNTLYNYWADAKTYEIESLKISKSEELSKLSNSLINELQLRLQKTDNSFYSTSRDKWRGVVYLLKKDCDFYIDTLLCFIHSKASLEINSFQRDVVLGSYGDFLEKLISNVYDRIVSTGNFRDSFFKYLAFEKPHELQLYLDLGKTQQSSQDFLLQVIHSERPYEIYDENLGYVKEVSIRYNRFGNDPDHLWMAETLRDLMYKAKSLNKLLAVLKKGNVQWDDSNEVVDALVKEININSTRKLG